MTHIVIDVAAVTLYVFLGMVTGLFVSKSRWDEACVMAGVFWPLALPIAVVSVVAIRMFSAAT